MYNNIMYVDLENPIVFKLKRIDRELELKIKYYDNKKYKIKQISNKIENSIKLYQDNFEKPNFINIEINRRIYNKAKYIYNNLLIKYSTIKRYYKLLCESKEKLCYIFELKKKQIIYDICQKIKLITKKIDEAMQINIFTSTRFKKNNYKINIENICEKFGFKHYLVYGQDEAVDNKLIYELRNTIKNNNNNKINIYLLTSDRALIVYSTYQYINNININFNILIQEKCCSEYLLSSIRYYNKIDKNIKLNNINIFNIDKKYELNEDIIIKKEIYPKKEIFYKLSWMPWIPGTEIKKETEDEWVEIIYKFKKLTLI